MYKKCPTQKKDDYSKNQWKKKCPTQKKHDYKIFFCPTQKKHDYNFIKKK